MTPRAAVALPIRPVEYVDVCLPRATPCEVSLSRASTSDPGLPRVVSDYAADGWTLVTARTIRASTHLLFRRPLRARRAAASRPSRRATGS